MYAILQPNNVLMYIGFAPLAGFTSIEVGEDFNLEAGKWRYENGEWLPVEEEENAS